MWSWSPWSSRSSVERLLRRSRSEAPDALVRGLAARVAAVAPERRSGGASVRGRFVGVAIVTAGLAAALASVGAASYPLSFVSGVAAGVTGEAVGVGHTQSSLRMVSLNAATSQYQNTTLTTTLFEPRVDVGVSEHDMATLSGQTADAGGTVTYTVYSNSSCTAAVFSAGTMTVKRGKVPNSNPFITYTPGTFYWQAVYSGDAKNSGSSSQCGSEIETVKNP
jgi:hypothetical protein